MDLGNLLAGIDPGALDGMSAALSGRSAELARENDVEASAWSRLYGYLSVEMSSAALRQRTGVSL
jgi:hypothetical protein